MTAIRAPFEYTKTIESTIMDDRENVFPIQIEYSYYLKGLFMCSAIVTHIDYRLCPDAVIDKSTLMEYIHEAIRKEEGMTEFEKQLWS